MSTGTSFVRSSPDQPGIDHPGLLILLRGLPGSGKSTFARALAASIGAVVLDKDLVRAALFPGETTEYSSRQDDVVMRLMLEAVREHLARRADRPVILDGRVHGKVAQVDLVRQFAADAG